MLSHHRVPELMTQTCDACGCKIELELNLLFIGNRQNKKCNRTASGEFLHVFTSSTLVSSLCPGSWNHRVRPDQDTGQPLGDRPVGH